MEAQHGYVTRAWADSADDQHLLERMIDSVKPTLPIDPDFDDLHYLLHTPFRYRPPLRGGSRFGGANEPAVWYGSENVDTALAEKSFHLIGELRRSSVSALPVVVEWTDFSIKVETRRGIDLTHPVWDGARPRIESPTDYEDSQRLGGDMRQADVEAFRFRSARDVRHGVNLGVFTPRVFASKSPDLTQQRTWRVEADHEGVTVERKQMFSFAEPRRFEARDFMRDGVWPTPP